MLSWTEIESRAVSFQKRWKDCEGHEKQEAQTFEKDFMHIFGVDFLEGHHEYPITDLDGRDGYIDYLLPGKILIEMKSKGESLTRAYNQAFNYYRALPANKQPKLILCCDFKNFEVKNMVTGQTYKRFDISRLKSHVRMFGEIAGYGIDDTSIQTDIQVNTDASYKLAEVHDQLKKHGYEGHQLEVYLVRLLFCLFAEDTGIFEKRTFEKYLKQTKEDGTDLSSHLMLLFDVLNTPYEKRMDNLPNELKRFRYINGGIFSETLRPAFFDKEMRKTLLQCCNFDWSYISPAIFGAMFQGVMDQKQRRSLGAHYTSEENILKVIKPLFLDELWLEFDQRKNTKRELEKFHNKICNLKFLDPAAGCFNFGIIAYRELRLLEFEIYKLLFEDQRMVLFDVLDHVSVNQFYAIECEEFPCQIGQVAMLLMKHQMDQLISNYFGINSIDFPIKESANVLHGNALKIDWHEVCKSVDYIFGNPPFVGKKEQTKDQKLEIKSLFDKKAKGVGDLDYVAGWYIKASEYIQGTHTKVAFVSTNSITQGEQIAPLWERLFKENIEINFAYRTFKWANEAKNKAAVHCVIIGFSNSKINEKYIFSNGSKKKVDNINAYLLDAPNIIISNKTNPLCDVPCMSYGNVAGSKEFVLSENDKLEIIKKEPNVEKFIYPFVGAEEIINNKIRYCFWLKNIKPNELRQSKEISHRVNNIRIERENSSAEPTRKKASTPHRFFFESQPDTNMIVVPKVSSENRKYIPLVILEPEVIVNGSALIIPNADLYLFGVLTSSIHNCWMRAVAGRMKSDYQYSKGIVYNNFLWPEITVELKKQVEETARQILNARELYPNVSLADMYGEYMYLYPELVKAHDANDRAVMKAYGFKPSMTEDEIVAELFKMYQTRTNEVK